MRRFFICDEHQITEMLSYLTRTSISDDGWTKYFRDDVNDEEWMLTRYKSELHGGGITVLKRLPEIRITDLIDIALTSRDKSEILGASLELMEREKYQHEDFREELIGRICQVQVSSLDEFEKERLRIVIRESELHSAINRREIVGKHYLEVRKDAEHFRKIADQAKRVLAQME